MNNNKTYCINIHCPFKECDKHLGQIEGVKYDGDKDKYVYDGDEKKYVNVASLDSVCDKYLGYLVDEIGAFNYIKNDFLKTNFNG